MGTLAISTDNYYRAKLCDMEYIAVLNNYPEYSLLIYLSKVLACMSFMLQCP